MMSKVAVMEELKEPWYLEASSQLYRWPKVRPFSADLGT